jgi:ubiquinol-cytochrome c reductase iron-sulfur subunit
MSEMSGSGRPGDPGEARQDPGGARQDPGPGPGVPAEAAEAGEVGGTGGRRRVVGTPPPAEARTLLGAEPDGEKAPARELPAEPTDPIQAKNAERLASALFILAGLAACGFIVAYVFLRPGNLINTEHTNFALGGCMAVAFLAMGAGFVVWVRNVMPQAEWTEERHSLSSTPEDRTAFAQTFKEGTDATQIMKRPLLRRTLLAATLPVAVAPIVLLRDLGPLPGTELDHTVWRKGLRLIVYGTNRPISPAEFSSPGAIISCIPDGYADDNDALAKAVVVIIKFRPGELVFGSPSKPETGKVVPNWTVDNIVAYSKICTHLGCPAALYESTTHHILCPCHQSTFVATEGAKVIFGPATRSLPQLPMTADAQGFLVARSDFTEPVGPSFWERS